MKNAPVETGAFLFVPAKAADQRLAVGT